MNTPFNLTRIANAIADLIKQGIVFRIYRQKNAMDWWHVAVYDTTKAASVHLVFNLNDPETVEQADDVASHTPVSRPAARPKTTARPKHTSRWWSRYNFEKNIMKMTLLALQERYPAEPSFAQTLFAEKLASMMSWAVSTARRHITQAAKMGILNRSVIGTSYHIAGLNDIDEQSAREEVADREQAPEPMSLAGERRPEDEKPAPRSAIAHEGRIQFEQDLEKAVDETVLP